MAVENYFNTYNVSLTQLTTNGTTLYVSQAAPIASGFRILIDSELMQVTAGGTTTTWTVIRNIEGTTLASHGVGAAVIVVLTAGALTAILAQQSYNLFGTLAAIPAATTTNGLYYCTNAPLTFRSNGASWDSVTQTDVYISSANYINSANFSWVNQSTSTETFYNGISNLVAATATNGTYNLRMRMKTLANASNYTVTMFVRPVYSNLQNYEGAGICLYDGAKVETFGGGSVDQWSATNAFSSEPWSNAPLAQYFDAAQPAFMRVQDTGSNRVWSYSADGVTYFTVYTETRTNYLTPTQVGYFVGNKGTATNTVQTSGWFYSFTETAP